MLVVDNITKGRGYFIVTYSRLGTWWLCLSGMIVSVGCCSMAYRLWSCPRKLSREEFRFWPRKASSSKRTLMLARIFQPRYLLLRLKVLTRFAFALLAQSMCWFPLVSIINNKLLVTGFSLQKHIFRVDVTCVHQISSGILIGFDALSYSTSSLLVPCPAGLKSSCSNCRSCHAYIYTQRRAVSQEAS